MKGGGEAMAKVEHRCPECGEETYRMTTPTKDPGKIPCEKCDGRRRPAARKAPAVGDLKMIEEDRLANQKILRLAVQVMNQEQRDSFEELVGERIDRIINR
jgi:hypothetical protein